MQEVMENEDLLVHVLRMAGHAPLRRAFFRRRALADGEGRREKVEDDNEFIEAVDDAHVDAVTLGEEAIAVCKTWRKAVLRNHSDVEWLRSVSWQRSGSVVDPWVCAMAVRSLPLSFMTRRQELGVVHHLRLDWQVRFTGHSEPDHSLSVVSMVCEVGGKTYTLPDDLPALDVTRTLDNVLDSMRFGFFGKDGQFFELNPKYDAIHCKFGCYKPEMFAGTLNPDGTLVLACGVRPPLPLFCPRVAEDTHHVVDAVAKYERMVPEEWEVDDYSTLTGHFDERGQRWTEPLPCPFVQVGPDTHAAVSTWWYENGDQQHLDVHQLAGFYEHFFISHASGGFTFRVCRKLAFMAKYDHVADRVGGKVARWADRYELDWEVLDRKWCKHSSRVWCLFTPRRCRVDDFLTSFRAYLITHWGEHDMSSLVEWEWRGVMLFSYGPYAYSLGKGLPHLMNVTRYRPYSTEEDLTLRTGPSTKAIRQLWDGYSAWLPGQRTALAAWKEV